MSEKDIMWADEGERLHELRDTVRRETDPAKYSGHLTALITWSKELPKDVADWPAGLYDDYRQLRLDLDFLIRNA